MTSFQAHTFKVEPSPTTRTSTLPGTRSPSPDHFFKRNITREKGGDGGGGSERVCDQGLAENPHGNEKISGTREPASKVSFPVGPMAGLRVLYSGHAAIPDHERRGRPRRQCKPPLLCRPCLSVPTRRCRCASQTWMNGPWSHVRDNTTGGPSIEESS